MFDVLLQVAQELNLDIRVTEKASGTLQFENATLSPAQLDLYCLYPEVWLVDVDVEGPSKAGDPVGKFSDWSSLLGIAKLSILVKTVGEHNSNVSIRANYSLHDYQGLLPTALVGEPTVRQLQSTSVLETEVRDGVLRRLSLPIPRA